MNNAASAAIGPHGHPPPHRPGESGKHNRLSPTALVAPLTPLMRLTLSETIGAAAADPALKLQLEAAPANTVNTRHNLLVPGLTDAYVRQLLDAANQVPSTTLAKMLDNRIKQLQRGDGHDGASFGLMCGCGG